MSSTPRKTPRKLPRASMTPSRGATPRKPSSIQERPQNDQGEEGIQVAIRMRPLNQNEGQHRRVWKVLPKFSSVAQTTVTGQPVAERVTGRTFFQFDQTFAEDVATRQVYDQMAKGIVTSVCTGLNGTIFAYGQTSSGKTHTMQGSGTIQEGATGGGGGIVHLAASDIFRHVQSQADRIFLVRVSFLEIYNEDVRDLLTDDNKTLQIREDPRRGVFVQSQEEIVTDFQSLLTILFKGDKSRHVSSTAMNERSSRSHTIFRITIESRKKSEAQGAENEDPNEDGAVLISTLNLVDLAGSESVRHTGATGDRQKEGGMINQSLLTLSRVIVALGTPNQSHINFRDSKLTRILQPSLSGNARMAVICCATPSELYLEETRSTLQFASRAKLVKTRAQVNEVLDDRSLIKRLQRELALARRNGGGAGAGQEHFKELEQKAADADAVAQEAADKLRRLQASILNSDGLFGTSATTTTDKLEDEASTKPRKRRLSEGVLGLGGSTPMKGATATFSPKTMPRATKRGKMEIQAPLSPSAELALLREALTAKSDMVTTWKSTVSEISRQVQLKESELIAANCSNDILRSERNSAIEDLASSIAALREEMVAVSTAHEAALKGKETAIEGALAKLERELEDRRVLEETVDSLQEEKLVAERLFEDERKAHKDANETLVSENTSLRNTVQSLDCEKESLVEATQNLETERVQLVSEKEELQEKFESLQEERVRSAFELAQSGSEKEQLVKERQKDKERLQDLNGKIEFLTSTMNETQDEKDAGLDEIKSLQKQLMCTQDELQTNTESLRDAIDTGNKLNETVVGLEELIGTVSTELEEWKDKCNQEIISKDATKAELVEVKETLGAITQDHAISQDAITNLKEDVESLSAELEQTKIDLCTATSAVTQFELLIVTLSAQRDETMASWNSSKANLDRMQQQISSLEVSLRQSEEDKLALAEKVQMLSVEVATSSQRIVELEGMLSSSEASLVELNGELGSFQAQLETLESQVAQLTEERDATQSRLTAGATVVENLEAAISGLETTVEQTGAQLGSALERTKELESHLLSASVEQDISASNLEAYETKVTELAASIEGLETAAEQTSLQLTVVSTERDVVLAEANQLKSSLTEASEGLLAAECVLEATRDKIDELEAEKVALLAGTETNETHLARATQDFEAVRFELEASNVKVNELSTKIHCLDATSEEASTRFEALSAEREVVLSRAAELESQLHEATEKFETLQSNSETHETLLASRTQELEAVRSELEASTTKVGELTATVEILTAKYDESSFALSQVDELDQTLNTIREDLEQSTSVVARLQEENQLLTDKLDSQAETFASVQSSEAVLKTELENTKSELEAVTNERNDLLPKLADAGKELQVRTNELISVHDLLESSNTRMEESKKRAYDLEDELESKESMLSQSLSTLEAERDTLTAQLTEQNEQKALLEERVLQLSISVSELTAKTEELKHLATTPSPADEKLESLEGENMELKQLLASSNTSIEEARQAALSADAELEDREKQLEEALHLLSQREEEAHLAVNRGNGSEELAEELEAVLEEKQKLETELANERDSRAKSEDEHKRLMGEEQRLLIQEAEGSMKQLRKEVATLEETLKRSEAEAYTARQENEELRDQGKRALKNAIQIESRVAALENENARLKRSSEKESENSNISVELSMAKAELSAARKSLAKLENKLRLVEQEKDGKTHELSSVLQTLKRLDVPSLEKENRRLQDEVHKLTSTISAATSGSKVEVQGLQSQLSELTDKLKSKDERIKKLNASKLTKDQVAAIKKMKVERVEYRSKLDEAEKEVEKLRVRLCSTPMESREDQEISELRFDKEALENKLRKYLSHCQRLEEEKAGILDVLRSSQHGDIFDGDISKTVVSLCDKLASLEEECGSLSKSENKASFYLKEVEQLREANGTLQSQISESRKKVDHLIRSEVELKEALTSLQRERDEFRLKADRAEGNVESVENEKSRQVRYLEQESLQLMLDLKAVKKQLLNTKAELNMLRAKAMDDNTMDLSGLTAPPAPNSQVRSKIKPHHHATSTPMDKENSVNVEKVASSVKARRAFGSIRKPRRAPGLGESFEQTEENTQECKQS